MSSSARNHYTNGNNNANALQVKALYDYVPDSTFEGKFLSFKSGEIITVIEKCEGGWYKGILPNNEEGLFPPTYCEELAPKRQMNVDTKKTSPTIKRMQTLLKLTVTGTGEKVEEVEQEATGNAVFTRERAQSDARVFSHSATNKGSGKRFKEVAQRVIEGKMLLEGRLAGRIDEEGVADGSNAAEPAPAVVIEPTKPEPIIVKENPENVMQAQLQKRISELETEKVVMLAEFTGAKEKLQEEFTHKIALLNDMLDEKSLIIEIMKKDLEIRAEENKEITIEMELEIERLLKSCADLEQQVVHLTPLDGDVLSPRDTRALPALQKHPNPPTPRISPSATPRTASPLSASSPSSLAAPAVPVSPSPVVSQAVPSSPVSRATPPVLRRAASMNEIPETPKTVQLRVPSSIIITPADTKPTPTPLRINSFPSLAALPKDILGPTSPRSAARSVTPRTPTSPRVPYSSALLDSSGLNRTDPRSKIPNFDSSLAKLAEQGTTPPLVLQQSSGVLAPEQAAVEISELKKRIAELETERLQMIEEYRTRKDKPQPESPAPIPSITSFELKSSTATSPITASSSLPRPITPPLPPIPTLTIPMRQSGNLPPVPLPPISTSQTITPVPSSPPVTSPPPLSTSNTSTQSPSQPVPKVQEPSASSSLQERPTRSRKHRNPTGPTGPSRLSSDGELPNKGKMGNIKWWQASIFVAVGSVAFYLVESLVHRYYV